MSKVKWFYSSFRCPQCHSSDLKEISDVTSILCTSCNAEYPISNGQPVLLRTDNDVFCLDDYQNSKVPLTHNANSFLHKIIPQPSVNLASQRVFSDIRERLEKMPKATVLVIGGGCQRQWLDERLGASQFIRIVYSDIDVGADVDLFCDGHDIPFVNDCFDAVVTTAVLEHVLYPERVASEIIRVLKVGGLLYSELPFMQQVHEGAYDFTRYTMSGHRRLFNRIQEIESGMIAGPATALVWAIENFALSFSPYTASRKLTKAVVRLLFGWIKYCDYLVRSNPAAMDGASCTYLFGRKIDSTIPDTKIIEQYSGAQVLSHK